MNWIDRYVSAVIHQLPASQRPAAEQKLRSRINDLLAQQTVSGAEEPAGEQADVSQQAADESTIRHVLDALGDPAELAEQYREKPRYLIGPEYFGIYWLVLRIVLIAAGSGLLIAKGIELAIGAYEHIWIAFAELVASLFQGLFMAFAFVTLIFFLIETFGTREVIESVRTDKKTWSVEDLPKIPSEKLKIKRGDPIANVIFSLLFLIVINIFPQLIGFYQQTDAGFQITGFLGDAVAKNLIWINTVIIAGIALDSVKIARGRWTWLIVAGAVAVNIFSLIIGLRVIRDPGFINQEFVFVFNNFLQQARGGPVCAWSSTLVTALTVLVVFGFVVEMITLAVKAYQLSQEKNESSV